jgi:hypothetical protein
MTIKLSMNVLLHPTYFANVAHFVALLKADVLTFEVQDNYQKQTYRNRTNIYGAQGKLGLTVPVNYSQKNRQLYRDVKIAYDSNWQVVHWKSLESAYKMSPYFEFYQDDLKPLFDLKEQFLLDFNLQCFKAVCACLELDIDYKITTSYEKTLDNIDDYRPLIAAKKETAFNFDRYIQVFTQKHGFISNLSILDLLFNEGPNTLNYLESQTLPI